MRDTLYRVFSHLFFFVREKNIVYYEEGDLIMKDIKFVKVLGMACAVIGFGLTIVQQQVEDKKMEETIRKEVAKQLKASEENE